MVLTFVLGIVPGTFFCVMAVGLGCMSLVSLVFPYVLGCSAELGAVRASGCSRGSNGSVRIHRVVLRRRRYGDAESRAMAAVRDPGYCLLRRNSCEGARVFSARRMVLFLFAGDRRRASRGQISHSLEETSCERITSSCSGRWNGIAGAPRARHFIMHSRRATTVSAPPLNCGVSRT